MGGLTGRLARLEAASVAAGGPDGCRACGLRHVRPMTLGIVPSIIVERTDMAVPSTVAEAGPRPRLCRCDPCCGDSRERAVAELTHDSVPPGSAATPS